MRKLMLMLASCISSISLANGKTGVTNFEVRKEYCLLDSENDPFIVLRAFDLNHIKMFWGVNPHTLETKIIEEALVSNCHSYLGTEISSYQKAILKYNTFTGYLQKQGLRKDPSENPKGGFLSVDLCPSSEPIDRDLFEKIGLQKWPVALSVSGLWMLRHSEDFKWLREKLIDNSILWINHSRNHPVLVNEPIEKNFLLIPKRNIRKEILDNEILLLQNGITPSIFFRFPGLVADQAALKVTKEVGVIPIGSNAWLSKAQKPTPGSVILIHGNGNDEKGLKIFNKDLIVNLVPLPFREILSIWRTP